MLFIIENDYIKNGMFINKFLLLEGSAMILIDNVILQVQLKILCFYNKSEVYCERDIIL